MTEVTYFMAEAPGPELRQAIDRLARTRGVRRIAVMPDAHVAHDVCVGTVTATDDVLLPAAVGGDIGCGMVAVRSDGSPDLLHDRTRAAKLLAWFAQLIPPLVRCTADAPALPDELLQEPIGAASLESLKTREARTELGTLGRGNHFLELQCDEEGGLWLLVHSGSRAVGPRVRDHFNARSEQPGALALLEASSEAGLGYLRAAAWAARYARENRACILRHAASALGELFGVSLEPDTSIEVDHNHVRREAHASGEHWVHRKGAMGLARDELGVVPGSMGTATYHVRGRAHPDALHSSAHGAGRAMSRGDARRRIKPAQLARESKDVWYDHRLASGLCEEAPSAYKDVHAVMRAQRELVKVVRRLRPMLVYKAV